MLDSDAQTTLNDLRWRWEDAWVTATARARFR
jgi:hypothetical protein